jgi:hypothetical protein
MGVFYKKPWSVVAVGALTEGQSRPPQVQIRAAKKSTPAVS